MAEIMDYERRGDLGALFEMTKKAERAQEERERIHDAVRCEVPAVTWEQHAAEQERCKSDHPACGSHRHSVSESLTSHCGKCCPPPPMSPSQRDGIIRLLRRPALAEGQMMWRLRLYCGHVIEKPAHRTHKTIEAAFNGSTTCPEYGLDPATIVDGEAIGPKAEPSQGHR